MTSYLEFDQDGMHFTEIQRQEYEGNCVFSAGYVDGAPVAIDTVYIRWQKDGDAGRTLVMSVDELQALICVASGTVWTKLLDERLKHEHAHDGDADKL